VNFPFHVQVQDQPFLGPEVKQRRMLKRLLPSGRDGEFDDDSKEEDEEDRDRRWSSSARTSSRETWR